MLKTRLSTGDLQRELRLTRAKFERILRDYARELPEPEILMGCRVWEADALGAFRAALRRDAEARS